MRTLAAGGLRYPGVEMTAITERYTRSGSPISVDERSSHRLNGWAIAIGVSVLIWSVSGASLWGIINIVN